MKTNIMKKPTFLIFIIVTAISILGGALTASPILSRINLQKLLFAMSRNRINMQPREKFVPGELLVKYKNTLGLSAQKSALKNKIAGTHKSNWRTSDGGQLHHISLADPSKLEETASELRKDPNVEYAQPNFIYRISSGTNDSDYGKLWGLKNTGQSITSISGTLANASDTIPSYTTNNPGTSGKDIDIETAWTEVTDCSSVRVAVVDSGVNYNHQDLSSNMADLSSSCKDSTNATISGGCANHGYDFVSNDADPMDLNGHGTHVAGTIGAVGNNNIGISGICQKANIIAVRVMDESGVGTSANIVKGILFAAYNGAKVINLSLGGEGNGDSATSSAIDTAKSLDVVVVAAAGNGGSDGVADNVDGPGEDGSTFTMVLPCAYTQDNILCVAALDQKYSLTSFSNYGITSVDIAAPGANIVSSWSGSETTISEDFSSGWTISTSSGSAWGIGSCTYPLNGGGSLTLPTMQLPAGSCGAYSGTGSTYASSSTSYIYKTFNPPSTADSFKISYLGFIYMEPYSDWLQAYYKPATGNPYPTGTSVGSLYYGAGSISPSYGLPNCIGQTNCTLGFRFSANSTNNYYGVDIIEMTVTSLDKDATDRYRVEDGTSMATPHVTGIIALVRAFNPTYTYAEAIAAVKAGGNPEATLAGKISTGNSADANGAIRYVQPPSGMSKSF